MLRILISDLAVYMHKGLGLGLGTCDVGLERPGLGFQGRGFGLKSLALTTLLR